MKTVWWAGQINLKGKKQKLLSCKCCVVRDLREGDIEKQDWKEARRTINNDLDPDLDY